MQDKRRSLTFTDLQFTASTWQYFACYYTRAREMCSGTTFRHSATLSKLYFFFDCLQYDFSLTWNKIPFHACAYWGVRGVGVQGGSVKNAFIPTERKKRVSSGKKTDLKTQHGQDPGSGKGIALHWGKISTKQQGCHSTSTKNWECTHRGICCFPAKPWAFAQPLNIRWTFNVSLETS